MKSHGWCFVIEFNHQKIFNFVRFILFSLATHLYETHFKSIALKNYLFFNLIESLIIVCFSQSKSSQCVDQTVIGFVSDEISN